MKTITIRSTIIIYMCVLNKFVLNMIVNNNCENCDMKMQLNIELMEIVSQIPAYDEVAF